MTDTAQQIIVLGAIAASILYLFLRGRKKKAGCGKGDCGCGKKSPSDTLNP